MSTRCNIHFTYSGETVANVYRHSDGYPDGEHGVPACLERFFGEVEEQTGGDTRFGDPEYLAAKFVVWQAGRNAKRHPERPLDFLSLGVCTEDHGDIEFVYTIETAGVGGGDRPKVTWEAA